MVHTRSSFRMPNIFLSRSRIIAIRTECAFRALTPAIPCEEQNMLLAENGAVFTNEAEILG